MRRLAQFVRLRLSRVSLLASGCLCVCVCLASRFSRLAQFVRLRASRVCVRLASACVSRRASASVVLFRVCLRLASVSRQGFRMLASVCVGRLVSRLSVLVNACGGLAHFMRRSSFKEFKRSSYYLIMSQCQSIHPIT